MGTFVVILIGGFICKFVYDSYLTDNTDRRFDEFSKSNPEAAARVLNNQGGILGTTPKRNKSVYYESLKYIANNNNWELHEVEEQMALQLENVITDRADYLSFMKKMQQLKGQEAVDRKIDPEDTTAAISFNLAKKIYSPLYEKNTASKEQELVEFLLKQYTEIIMSIGKDNPMKGTPMEGMAYEIGINNTTEQLLKDKSLLSIRYGVSSAKVESTIQKAEIAVRQNIFE
jgi:hypothetical protein